MRMKTKTISRFLDVNFDVAYNVALYGSELWSLQQKIPFAVSSIYLGNKFCC